MRGQESCEAINGFVRQCPSSGIGWWTLHEGGYERIGRSHGADLDASLGIGDLGGVGPASPARSNVRRVCAGSTLGRRSGSAFTVGLSSSGVVVLRGRPSGRAARKAAARSLSTTTNWLWAVAITVCPHVTRSGRTVVYTR